MLKSKLLIMGAGVFRVGNLFWEKPVRSAICQFSGRGEVMNRLPELSCQGYEDKAIIAYFQGGTY